MSRPGAGGGAVPSDGGTLHPFLRAAAAGDTASLEAQFHPVCLGLADADGKTALHYAASSNQEGAVAWLLARGADIEIRTKKGLTPLHYAVFHGHRTLAAWLLERGAAVSAADATGRSVLHLACVNGHTELARWLLEATAGSFLAPDIHGASAEGMKCVHFAALGGHLGTLQWLAEAGADLRAVTASGMNLLHLACMKGHLEVAKWLVEAGSSTKAVPAPAPLFEGLSLEAIPDASTATTASSGRSGLDPAAGDARGRTPLHLAVVGQHEAIVLWLLRLKAGCSPRAPDADGKTPLSLAAGVVAAVGAPGSAADAAAKARVARIQAVLTTAANPPAPPAAPHVLSAGEASRLAAAADAAAAAGKGSTGSAANDSAATPAADAVDTSAAASAPPVAVAAAAATTAIAAPRLAIPSLPLSAASTPALPAQRYPPSLVPPGSGVTPTAAFLSWDPPTPPSPAVPRDLAPVLEYQVQQTTASRWLTSMSMSMSTWAPATLVLAEGEGSNAGEEGSGESGGGARLPRARPAQATPYPYACVTGLQPGTVYTFRVRARNANGWSSWSAPSEEVTTAPPVGGAPGAAGSSGLAAAPPAAPAAAPGAPAASGAATSSKAAPSAVLGSPVLPLGGRGSSSASLSSPAAGEGAPSPPPPPKPRLALPPAAVDAASRGDLDALLTALQAATASSDPDSEAADPTIAGVGLETWVVSGAEPSSGRSLLHHAAAAGHAALVAWLCAQGAEPNARDGVSATPLLLAVLGGHLSVLRALVLAGADLDAGDAKGYTPLHYACLKYRVGIVRWLCEAGADVYAKTSRGAMAVDLVQDKLTALSKGEGGAGGGASSREELIACRTMFAVLENALQVVPAPSQAVQVLEAGPASLVVHVPYAGGGGGAALPPGTPAPLLYEVQFSKKMSLFWSPVSDHVPAGHNVFGADLLQPPPAGAGGSSSGAGGSGTSPLLSSARSVPASPLISALALGTPAGGAFTARGGGSATAPNTPGALATPGGTSSAAAAVASAPLPALLYSIHRKALATLEQSLAATPASPQPSSTGAAAPASDDLLGLSPLATPSTPLRSGMAGPASHGSAAPFASPSQSVHGSPVAPTRHARRAGLGGSGLGSVAGTPGGNGGGGGDEGGEGSGGPVSSPMPLISLGSAGATAAASPVSVVSVGSANTAAQARVLSLLSSGLILLVTGLAPDTRYTFQYRVRNLRGWSAWSPKSLESPTRLAADGSSFCHTPELLDAAVFCGPGGPLDVFANVPLAEGERPERGTSGLVRLPTAYSAITLLAPSSPPATAAATLAPLVAEVPPLVVLRAAARRALAFSTELLAASVSPAAMWASKHASSIPAPLPLTLELPRGGGGGQPPIPPPASAGATTPSAAASGDSLLSFPVMTGIAMQSRNHSTDSAPSFLAEALATGGSGKATPTGSAPAAGTSLASAAAVRLVPVASSGAGAVTTPVASARGAGGAAPGTPTSSGGAAVSAAASQPPPPSLAALEKAIASGDWALLTTSPLFLAVKKACGAGWGAYQRAVAVPGTPPAAALVASLRGFVSTLTHAGAAAAALPSGAGVDPQAAWGACDLVADLLASLAHAGGGKALAWLAGGPAPAPAPAKAAAADVLPAFTPAGAASGPAVGLWTLVAFAAGRPDASPGGGRSLLHAAAMSGSDAATLTMLLGAAALPFLEPADANAETYLSLSALGASPLAAALALAPPSVSTFVALPSGHPARAAWRSGEAGSTVAQLAAFSGAHEAVTSWLAAPGAAAAASSLAGADASGWGLWQYAATGDAPEVLEALAQAYGAGAAVAVRDGAGRTLVSLAVGAGAVAALGWLWQAAAAGDAALASCWLCAGAGAAVPDALGKTPLHYLPPPSTPAGAAVAFVLLAAACVGGPKEAAAARVKAALSACDAAGASALGAAGGATSPALAAWVRCASGAPASTTPLVSVTGVTCVAGSSKVAVTVAAGLRAHALAALVKAAAESASNSSGANKAAYASLTSLIETAFPAEEESGSSDVWSVALVPPSGASEAPVWIAPATPFPAANGCLTLEAALDAEATGVQLLPLGSGAEAAAVVGGPGAWGLAVRGVLRATGSAKDALRTAAGPSLTPLVLVARPGAA